MKTYVEDTSIRARSEEIAIKVARIQDMLEAEGLNALYLTRSANYAWITAGANGVITICMEAWLLTGGSAALSDSAAALGPDASELSRGAAALSRGTTFPRVPFALTVMLLFFFY